MVTRDADWAGKTRDVSRVSCRTQSAFRVTVRHRMNVLDSICYNHNYGNHSNMTDSKLPLLKRSLFSELRTYDHIMPIASPSVFNLGIYFQPHFCYEVSEVHPHILAVDTISRDLFSYSLFWPWRYTGASMVIFFFIPDTYSINTKWLPHRIGPHYNFWIKLYGFKYDSMIH